MMCTRERDYIISNEWKHSSLHFYNNKKASCSEICRHCVCNQNKQFKSKRFSFFKEKKIRHCEWCQLHFVVKRKYLDYFECSHSQWFYFGLGLCSDFLFISSFFLQIVECAFSSFSHLWSWFIAVFQLLMQKEKLCNEKIGYID